MQRDSETQNMEFLVIAKRFAIEIVIKTNKINIWNQINTHKQTNNKKISALERSIVTLK